MDTRTYTPKIKRAEVDLIPLLPGLAEQLKVDLEVPEMKGRHVRKDENGRWTLDEDIESYLWYPGGPTQTCFWEIVRTGDAAEENNHRTVDYYQMEYFHIIPFLTEYKNKWSNEDRMWIIADINNVQLEAWLMESGYLDESDKIIKSLRENGKTIRNQYNDDMESGQDTANG